MRFSIVTVAKVALPQHGRMMEAPQAIIEELLGKDCVIAVAILLGKALLSYTIFLYCLLHHLFCKDQLVPPVEVSFQ
jgi:hypothetical protein